MSLINKDWHSKNKIPKNSSFEQRAEWHLSHQVKRLVFYGSHEALLHLDAKNCKCREMPEKLKAELKEKGYKV